MRIIALPVRCIGRAAVGGCRATPVFRIGLGHGRPGVAACKRHVSWVLSMVLADDGGRVTVARIDPDDPAPPPDRPVLRPVRP